jgi:hypothetical protein
MRSQRSQRNVRLSAGVALLLALTLTMTIAMAEEPAVPRDPAAGSKGGDTAIRSAEGRPHQVPGVTPLGAILMTFLMLSASSLALYGGSLLQYRPSFGKAGSGTTGERAPVAVPQARPARKRRPPVQKRQHQLRRSTRLLERPGRTTSQSKKQCLSAGCRGPLRKT